MPGFKGTKHIKSVSIVVLCLIMGCQPILFKLYGIKNPEIENEKSILKKALKFGLDTSNIVSVNSKDFLYVLKGQSIPDAAIYDSKGKYIEYRNSDSACNAGLFQFIPALNASEQYHQPDSADLFTELQKFRDLKGNVLKEPTFADFYVLIYWTTWTGRLNKDHVKIWESLARQNSHAKIEVIKVSLDLQEHWEAQDRERILKAIQKNK